MGVAPSINSIGSDRLVGPSLHFSLHLSLSPEGGGVQRRFAAGNLGDAAGVPAPSRKHTQIEQSKEEEGVRLSVFLPLHFPVIWSRLSTISWSFHFLERMGEEGERRRETESR